MPNPVQIKALPHIHSGATPASQTKLTDLLVIEHMDAPSSTDKTLKMMIGQLLCKPVFTVASQQSGNGRYSATCQNYAGFSLFYTDSQNARHYFIGLPIKVIFTPACNYGSVSGNTYPTISFNGSDFIPILANGKTVASGAWQAGQSLEGCIIQTNLNGATVYAFDLNSNIRQQDSNSTIYSDGRIEYNNKIHLIKDGIKTGELTITTDTTLIPFCLDVIICGQVGYLYGKATLYGYGPGTSSRFHATSEGNITVSITDNVFTITPAVTTNQYNYSVRNLLPGNKTFTVL